MPTYDYRCEKGHLFEVFEKISDGPLRGCPECGEPAERQISGGTGFLTGGEGGGSNGGGWRPPAGEPPHAPRDTTFGE